MATQIKLPIKFQMRYWTLPWQPVTIRQESQSRLSLPQIWSLWQEKYQTLTSPKRTWNALSEQLYPKLVTQRTPISTTIEFGSTMSYTRSPLTFSSELITLGQETKESCLDMLATRTLTICPRPSTIPTCCLDSSIECEKKAGMSFYYRMPKARSLLNTKTTRPSGSQPSYVRTSTPKAQSITCIKPSRAPLTKLSLI